MCRSAPRARPPPVSRPLSMSTAANTNPPGAPAGAGAGARARLRRGQRPRPQLRPKLELGFWDKVVTVVWRPPPLRTGAELGHAHGRVRADGRTLAARAGAGATLALDVAAAAGVVWVKVGTVGLVGITH